MPDLRVRAGPRRPVRQLRQPARPDRPDRAAVEDRRRAAGLPGDLPPVPRSARLRGAARRLDRSAGPLASERAPFLAAAREGASPPARHARSGLGCRIPVPGYEERDDKRVYVWFDAVIGYLSASVEWAANRGTPDAWREWWQDPAARHSYFMGKDNIVFHSVIWPSQLLGYAAGGVFGAGRGALQLPYDIVSSEFLTMEGKQFSTSRDVVIYVGDVLDRYSADALRYYLTAAGPETQDADFTWAEFVRRNNDELVANWGNLVNRVLTSVFRSFGEVPPAAAPTRRRRRGARGRRSGFRHGRSPDRGDALQGRARRGDAARHAGQPVPQRTGSVGGTGDRPRAGRDDPPRRAPVHRQPQGAVHPVSPVQLPAPPRAARARGMARRAARDQRGVGAGRIDPRGARAATSRRGSERGRRRRFVRGRSCASRSRSSPSSTRRASSQRSSRGWRRAAAR